jgi:hypothetical protein
VQGRGEQVGVSGRHTPFLHRTFVLQRSFQTFQTLRSFQAFKLKCFSKKVKFFAFSLREQL